MPKIKHTKSELKNQRDDLRRFARFLPTLELKKQQLQIEVRKLNAALEASRAEEAGLRAELDGWVRLFAEPFELGAMLRLKEVRRGAGNIAGVAIPIFQEAIFERVPLDLFQTPPWLDDGLAMLERLGSLKAAQAIMETQVRLLSEELRTTTQRVNLFEKVKIPECTDNIRVIRIFLGDEQTAAVARAKLAKGKAMVEARVA
ncbi:MAG: V-type ATP synthase subunit D [Verrucomicrobia bacterium]|nr:V-type ATP synthase subunit D [Verrucomicrobiota bacterium]MBU4429517.1 V-type ATP synthase subunit D [Verrucomicrobiota bacterium]MCG2678603.1 V-type ATP synthase subunit D [Kiritimatiellia bacterium]